MAVLPFWIIRRKQELDYYGNNYGAETVRLYRMVPVDSFPAPYCHGIAPRMNLSFADPSLYYRAL
jgi:hypothetical protein